MASYWKKWTNLWVSGKLRLAKNATMEAVQADGTTTTIDLAELAAIDSIGAADLAKIDGITNGTAAAGKAVVLDSNLRVGGVGLVERSLVSLSNANLLALAATPIEVVAAPGSGKMILVLAWRFRLIFVATAMDDAAADGDLILEYDGGSTIDTMQSDGLIDASATTQGLSSNLTELLVAETAVANKAVDVSNAGDEFTAGGGGDATAEVEVFYLTLDVDPS